MPADEDGLARLVLELGPEVRACLEMMSGAVWVRERLAAAGWERLKRRLDLVRLRASAKNRVFGLLSQWGLRIQLERLLRGDAMELLADRGAPEVWRRSVAEALAVIELLDARIAPLERELVPLARADRRVQLLDTIPGIGTALGLTIAAEIGEVARFQSPRKLIGYAGLAPRIKQSDERSRSGALSKAGSRTLRFAAVEAAQGA